MGSGAAELSWAWMYTRPRCSTSFQELTPQDRAQGMINTMMQHYTHYRHRTDAETQTYLKLFSLAPDGGEKLVKSFFGALKRTVLHAGRLYISSEHLAFRASSFGSKMSFLTTWHNVAHVRECMVEGVNAGIEIIFHSKLILRHNGPIRSKKYEEYSYLKMAWFKNSKHVFHGPERSLQKRRAGVKGADGKCRSEKGEPLQRRRFTTALTRGEGEAEMIADDMDEEPDDLESEEAESDKAEEEEEEGGEAGAEALAGSALATVLDGAPETREKILDVEAAVPLDFVKEMIRSADTTSGFGKLYIAARKISKLAVGEWEDEFQGSHVCGQVRAVSCTVKLPTNPMLPASSRQTIVHHLKAAESDLLLLERTVITHDIPYGDRFQVEDVWAFRQLGLEALHVVCHAGTHFRRGCMLKSTLHKNCLESSRAMANELVAVLVQSYKESKNGQEKLAANAGAVIRNDETVGSDKSTLMAAVNPDKGHDVECES
eukprot:gene15802-18738_t